MVSIEQFSGVVSEIYASSLEPANWPVALSEISRMMDATGSGLVINSSGGRTVMLGASMPVEAVTSYEQYYNTLDFVLDTCERSPAGLVRGGQEINAGRTLTEFYVDWQKPFELTDGLFVQLSRGPSAVSFAISAPKRSERFDSPERVRIVSNLFHHLRQALHTQRHFAEIGVKAVDVAELIDTFRSGIAIIDGAHAVAQLNSAARRILTSRDGLLLRTRTIEALRPSTNAQLQRNLAQAIDAHSTGIRAGSSLVCGRPSGKRPYVVHVHPVGHTDDGVSAAKAILIVVDQDGENEPSPTLLRNAFGLTNAEAAVALRALYGHGLSEIAQDLALSRATVNTHLQRIYDKTGAHRQAELVRLLLALTAMPMP